MKRKLYIFALIVCLFFPAQKTHAAGAVAALLEVQILADAVFYAGQLAEMAMAVKHAYAQLKELKDSAERAVNNLKGVADIQSISDFKNWFNRQLYLERETEYRFNRLGVKIGKTNYKLFDIDKIPDALKYEYYDKFKNDFSEEEKRDMWVSMGLSPGNYAYIKTWQDRNEKIAREIRTHNDVFADEFEEAANRNDNLMNKYAVENLQLDQNEILKESHITGMHTEMSVRENTMSIMKLLNYELSRDRLAEAPATPVQPYRNWNESIYGSITPNSFYKMDYSYGF